MVVLGTLTMNGTATVLSSLVDLRGFDAASIVLRTNTVTDAGTAAGFTMTVQHSDTTATGAFAAIAAADSVTGAVSNTVTVDATNNVIVGAIGYVGNKRYVRVSATGTAGSDATVNVYALLTEPARAKTAFVGTAVAAT
jgi:hypothetical protein